jgi:hypothetical protein
MLLYILLGIFHIIYPLDVKFCTNCKFIIRGENLIYSQCFLFPKITKENEYKKNQLFFESLVTGVVKEEKISDIFYFCTTSREFENMCGIQGNKYEEK